MKQIRKDITKQELEMKDLEDKVSLEYDKIRTMEVELARNRQVV